MSITFLIILLNGVRMPNSYGFSPGTLYGYNKNGIEDQFNVADITGQHAFITCFATYFSRYKPQKLYYAFPCVPDYFPKVIDDLNGLFKNIKYEIIKEQTAYLQLVKLSTNYWSELRTPLVYKLFAQKIDSGGIPVKKYLLSNSFADGYTEQSKKFLQYNLSILVRMLSFPENYLSGYDEDKLPEEDYVDFLVRINNRNKGYRTFSERTIYRETIESLDNIENCNKSYTRLTNGSRQTKIALVASTAANPRYKIKYKNFGYLRYDFKTYINSVYYHFVDGKQNLDNLVLTWFLTWKGKTFDIDDAEMWAKHLNYTYKTKDFEVVPAD